MGPLLIQALRRLLEKEEAGELFDRLRDDKPDGSFELALLLATVRNGLEKEERYNRPVEGRVRWNVVERLADWLNGVPEPPIEDHPEFAEMQSLTQDEREAVQWALENDIGATSAILKALREAGANSIGELGRKDDETSGEQSH